MSGQVPEAAVEAGARAHYPDAFDRWPDSLQDEYRDSAAITLAAALPHIRRTVIEELIADELRIADENENSEHFSIRLGSELHRRTAAVLRGRLRAELEGGGRG